ncbi:MAG: monovalent cation/H+ antiporter complex subunit F [Clostridia bacterium]|nr:monovalent cation/H+ antiporter complex subunit F [Clostridia bacterium]
MENAYRILYLCILFGLGIGILFSLIRAIRGPRVADRVMGINMIGTLSLLAIAVIALYGKESWLLDVSLIYGMISFLAVAVLAMTRINRKQPQEAETEEHYE